MEFLEYRLIIRLLVALGIGFLVGLERERRHEREIFAGIRTLPLVALSGAIVQQYFQRLLLPAFVLFVALLVVAYAVKVQRVDIGMTSAVATLLTFLFGAMSVISEQAMLVAVMMGIITAILLAVKDPLHRFANEIDPDEMYAVLKFLVVSLVIFPLLPDRSLDSLLGLNPQFVWLMVIFVSGIGFGAYILTKLLGAKTGIGLSGVLGGMISSTATTVAMARKSIMDRNVSTIAALATVIACLAMFPRMIIEILVVYPSLVELVLVPTVIMVGLGFLPAVYLLWVTSREETPEVNQDNPFRLKPALIFGAIFAVVLLLSEYSLEFYGSSGILITAAVSGLADVDAITLSVGRLMQQDQLAAETAARAVIIGAVSNTVMKMSLTWMMGRFEHAWKVTAVLGLSILGGLGSLLFI